MRLRPAHPAWAERPEINSMKTLGYGAAIAAAFLSFALTAAPAAAGETNRDAAGRWSTRIAVDSLDLTNPVTIDTLQRRIVAAANEVCGLTNRGPYAGLSRRRATCAREAADRAIATAQIDALSAVHAALDARQRYAALRPAPDSTLLAVAEAAMSAGGSSSSAGTIYQPDR